MTEPASPIPSGLVYADVPNRAIAYIIDAIILAIIAGLLAGIVGLGIVGNVVTFLIGAGYFIYTWTSLRGTLGMKVLGMQVGNAGDGATLTQEQALRRFAALAAPGLVAQIFASIAVIGPVLGLAAFAWFVFLLYTTYSSPTKQGWHDHFANSQVVKALGAVK